MPKIRNQKPKSSTKKRGAPNKKSGARTSFRVRLEGLVTPVELKAMLNEALDEVEALGCTHLRACYLYGTPADARGERVTLLKGGKAVSEIIIEPPYRSAADEHGV